MVLVQGHRALVWLCAGAAWRDVSVGSWWPGRQCRVSGLAGLPPARQDVLSAGCVPGITRGAGVRWQTRREGWRPCALPSAWWWEGGLTSAVLTLGVRPSRACDQPQVPGVSGRASWPASTPVQP